MRARISLVTASAAAALIGCSGSGSGSGSSGASVAVGTTSSGSVAVPTPRSGPGAVPGSTAAPGSVAVGATAPTGSASPAGVWLKGDLHSHSSPYSPDAQRQGGDSPAVCIALAEACGLDYFALTDHRTIDQIRDPGYRSSKLTLLPGEEWGGPSHCGFVGLSRVVAEVDTGKPAPLLNPQVSAAFDDVHRQGGVVTLNHPAHWQILWIWRARDFDAVEVWNAFWAFPEYRSAKESELDDKLRGNGLLQAGIDAMPELRDAVRKRQGPANDQSLTFWENLLNAGMRPAIVGGGDRHMALFPGVPTTWVFSKDRSPPGILDAIKRGRTYVAAQDGPEVELAADGDGDGVFETIVGGDVPIGKQVTFRARIRRAKGGIVDVIRDGKSMLRLALPTDDETVTWKDTATSRAWWRIDVREKVDLSLVHGGAFQTLALAGSGGLASLQILAQPLGFTVSLNTRIPNVKLPREYARILNSDWKNAFGWARGAITSPIYAR